MSRFKHIWSQYRIVNYYLPQIIDKLHCGRTIGKACEELGFNRVKIYQYFTPEQRQLIKQNKLK